VGKHVRVNGYDFDKSARIDKTKSKKQVKGKLSNTYQKSLKQKNKVNLIHWNDIETLFEMFQNPQMYNALILGEEYTEQQIIESFRYQPSVGDIDFATLISNNVKNYAIKNFEDIINRDDWEWVIDEPFRSTADTPSGAFPDSTTWALGSHYQSGGDALQSRTLDWVLYSGASVTDDTTSIEGDQSVKLDGDRIRCQLDKLYSNYEVSYYVYHDNSAGASSLLFNLNGYNTSVDNFYNVKLDVNNQKVEIGDNFSTVLKSKIMYLLCHILFQI
jgi:hypothetical protein